MAVLRGKIAVIGDTHSNLEAVNAVFRDIRKKGVEKVLAAGDLIGYGPDPVLTLKKLLKEGVISCQGNHEANLDLHNIVWFNQWAKPALVWTSGHLSKEEKAYLLGLKKKVIETVHKKRIVVVHGSPDDPLYQYTMPDTKDEVLKGYLKKTRADVLIMGHTHYPFIKTFRKKIVLNPGSVGQPRDGDPRASYAVVNLRNMKAEIVRVKYNFKRTSEKIMTAGLPEFLAYRLSRGV